MRVFWQYLCELCFSVFWYIRPLWTNALFKTGTQLDGDFTDGQLTSAGPEFLNKAFIFFPLENVNLSKAKSWEYISLNFTFLMNISQVWNAFSCCSKALEQKIARLLQCSWGEIRSHTQKAELPVGLLPHPQAVMLWGFSSASSRVTLQTELTYWTLKERERCVSRYISERDWWCRAL